MLLLPRAWAIKDKPIFQSILPIAERRRLPEDKAIRILPITCHSRQLTRITVRLKSSKTT